MRTTAAPVLLALTLLVTAGGCGGDDPGDASTPTPTAAVTATTAPDSAVPEPSVPAFPAGLRPDDGGRPSGYGLGLTGVRTAAHSGYDRIVFELAGTGTPGWYVDYTTRPRADGSGEPVELEGTAYLQVLLRGVGLTYDTGIAPYGDSSTRVPGTGTDGVVEIAPGGVFEGDQLAFIGLSGDERPFRVFALTDPTRVVVDVEVDSGTP